MSDLISSDTKIEWQGLEGSVHGTVKYINQYDAFGSGDLAHGNYFPFFLDDEYRGEPITVKRTSGTPSEKTQADTQWVLRLTDGTGTKFSISCKGIPIADLDFSTATLHPDALDGAKVMEQTQDLGSFQKKASDLVKEDARIGADGGVTGTLKYISGWTQFSSATEEQSGHYLPVHLSDIYKDKPISVNGKGPHVDQDWILLVKDNNSTFAFKTDETEMFTLNVKNATLEAKPEDEEDEEGS